MSDERLIWIDTERCFGWIIRLNAYYSLVRFSKGGVEHEVYLENDEFHIMDEGEDE